MHEPAKKRKCDCPPGTLSPTQIKEYRHCPRKWWYRYREKRQTPESTSLKLGKDVHEILENYVLKGKKVDPTTQAGAVALPALDLLPEQFGPGYLIEQHLTLKLVDTDTDNHEYLLHGYADLLEETTPTVWDYKTTADFKWALKAEDLAKDPQAVIYAAAVMSPEFAGVKLHWLYLKTRGAARASLVQIYLFADQIESALKLYVLPAAREIRQIKTVKDTYADLYACAAYGGCPFVNICPEYQNQGIKMLYRGAIKNTNETNHAPVVPPDAPPADEINDAYEHVIPRPLPLQADEAPKRKRGRPRKLAETDKLPPVNNTHDTSDDDDEDEPQTKTPEPKYENVSGNPPEGFILLIGATCNEAKPLATILRPILDKLQSDLGVPHHKLAKASEYGKGDAVLIAAFAEAAPELSGFIYANPRDADQASLLGYLESRAIDVIRAVL